MKIYKTSKHSPIIFDEHSDDKSFDLSPTLHSNYLTSSGLNSANENYGIEHIELSTKVYLRDKNVLIHEGCIAFYYKYPYRFAGAAIICHKKVSKLNLMDYYALVFNDGLSSTEKTILNKFLRRYNITRKNVINLNKKEFMKEVLWPIELNILDWNKEVQLEMSNKFIKTLRENV
jgi:hypothetical protein